MDGTALRSSPTPKHRTNGGRRPTSSSRHLGRRPGYIVGQRRGVPNAGLAFIPLIGPWIVILRSIGSNGWLSILGVIPYVSLVFGVWAALPCHLDTAVPYGGAWHSSSRSPTSWLSGSMRSLSPRERLLHNRVNVPLLPPRRPLLRSVGTGFPVCRHSLTSGTEALSARTSSGQKRRDCSALIDLRYQDHGGSGVTTSWVRGPPPDARRSLRGLSLGRIGAPPILALALLTSPMPECQNQEDLV